MEGGSFEKKETQSRLTSRTCRISERAGTRPRCICMVHPRSRSRSNVRTIESSDEILNRTRVSTRELDEFSGGHVDGLQNSYTAMRSCKRW